MSSDKQSYRKTAPAFLAMIGLVAFVMIIAYLRQADFLELVPPEGRVRALFTVEDRLVAVSDQKQVHVWEWKDLAAPPQKLRVEGGYATLAAQSQLISISAAADALTVSKIGSAKQPDKILVPWGWKCRILRTDRNGRFTAVGLESADAPTDSSQGGTDRIAVAIFESESRKLSIVATFDRKGGDLALGDVSVNQEGGIAAIAGSNEGGWATLVDVVTQNVLWEKRFDGTPKLDIIKFSPDSRIVYVAGQSEKIYALDAQDGRVLNEWTIGTSKEEEAGLQFVYVMAMDVSPDGRRIAAAGVHTRVYMWDTASGEAVRDWQHGQRSTLGGMAFSPDSSRLATSGVQPITKIRVWPQSLSQ